jgi:hypothetical protein
MIPGIPQLMVEELKWHRIAYWLVNIISEVFKCRLCLGCINQISMVICLHLVRNTWR